MNRMVENYLRYYCNHHQNDWDELLAGAEFAYNSAISDDLGMSPFEVYLGWKPKSPLDILNTTPDSNESVEEFKTRLKLSWTTQSMRTNWLRRIKEQDLASSTNLIRTKLEISSGSTSPYLKMLIPNLKSRISYRLRDWDLLQ